jgi:hypothetical protein
LKLGMKEAPNLLRRTLAERFDGKKTKNRILASFIRAQGGSKALSRKNF